MLFRQLQLMRRRHAPEAVVKRRLGADAFVLAPLEGHAAAVEKHPLGRDAAVRSVADYRQAAVGQMHPDLVGPAGQRPGFDEDSAGCRWRAHEIR